MPDAINVAVDFAGHGDECEGNLSAEDLHEKSWAIVRSYFDLREQQALTRYQWSAAAGKASNRIDEIAYAARHGKIQTLFVSNRSGSLGVTDPESNNFPSISTCEAHKGDILDSIAAETILHGGSVYTLARRALPDGSLAAAVYR